MEHGGGGGGGGGPAFKTILFYDSFNVSVLFVSWPRCCCSNSGTGSSLNPDQFRLPDHRSPGSGFMQNHGDTGRSLRTSVSLNYSFDSVGYATLIDIDIDIGTMISPFSGNFICDNSFG